MSPIWNRPVAAALLAASLVGCDSTGPGPADLTDVLLDFCGSDTPVFFGLQNEGADWSRVTPDVQGTFAFQATRTFTLAIVHEVGGRVATEYIYATPGDIESLNGVSCRERQGTKSLSGTVAGVPLGSGAVVTLANSDDVIEAPATSYQLVDLPNGPYDLVATREQLGVSSVTPDRVIIRRAQDRTSGSAFPVLDFASTEAVPTVAHNVTASGLSGNDINEYALTFSTLGTRRHSLSLVETFTSSTRPLRGIPQSLTQAGDYHELEVLADAGSAYRGSVHYYRQPGDRAVSLGSHLDNPTLTFLAGSSQLRPRTQLASQFEYGSMATVLLRQDVRTVAITATSAYFGGTPVTWDLSFPDLTNMTGFPSGARLQTGQTLSWNVEAYGGTGGLSAFFGKPSDGAVLNFAGRSFSSGGAVASQAARAEGGSRRAPLSSRTRTRDR